MVVVVMALFSLQDSEWSYDGTEAGLPEMDSDDGNSNFSFSEGNTAALPQEPELISG